MALSHFMTKIYKSTRLNDSGATLVLLRKHIADWRFSEALIEFVQVAPLLEMMRGMLKRILT